MRPEAKRGNADMRGRIMTLAKRRRYLIVEKDTMEDARLSFRARGLLAYLLCQPPDWVVVEKALVKHLAAADKGEGRDAIRAAMDELKTRGYFRRSRRRNIRGQFVYVTVVFESPQIFEDRYRQGHLWEDFLQEVVPGSMPEDEDEPPPLFADVARSGRGRVSSRRTAAESPPETGPGRKSAFLDPPAVDWKTVDGLPAPGKPSTVNPTVLNTELLKCSSSSARAQPVAAESAAAAEIRAALAGAGIGEPALGELAASKLTREKIERVISIAQASGKGPGAIVNNLRAMAAAPAEHPSPRRRGRGKSAADAGEAERRQVEEGTREIERILAALSDSEFAEHAAALRRESPTLARLNPATHPTFRAAIAQRAERRSTPPHPGETSEARDGQAHDAPTDQPEPG